MAEAMIAAPQGEGSQSFVSIQRLGLGLDQLPRVQSRGFGFRLYSVDETWLPKLERRNPGRITSEVELARGRSQERPQKTATKILAPRQPRILLAAQSLSDELGIETVKLDPGYM